MPLVLRSTSATYVLQVRRPTKIGRGTSSDIVLSSKSVSEHHAEITIPPTSLTPGTAVLSDTSSNGSFVNDERVKHDSVHIKHGDVVRFGYSKTAFRCEYSTDSLPGGTAGGGGTKQPLTAHARRDQHDKQHREQPLQQQQPQQQQQQQQQPSASRSLPRDNRAPWPGGGGGGGGGKPSRPGGGMSFEIPVSPRNRFNH